MSQRPSQDPSGILIKDDYTLSEADFTKINEEIATALYMVKAPPKTRQKLMEMQYILGSLGFYMFKLLQIVTC